VNDREFVLSIDSSRTNGPESFSCLKNSYTPYDRILCSSLTVFIKCNVLQTGIKSDYKG